MKGQPHLSWHFDLFPRAVSLQDDQCHISSGKKNPTKQNQTNSSEEQAVLGQGTALRCKASSLDRNSLRQGMFQFASQGNNPILDTQSQWKKNLLRLVKPKELRDVKQAVTCFIPTCIVL